MPFLFSNSSFSHNIAHSFGGAISSSSESQSSSQPGLRLSDSEFTENVAGFSGGAISSNFIPLTLDTCSFRSNTATNGGAIIFGDIDAVRPLHPSTTVFPYTLSQIDCTFERNRASLIGGGVVISAGTLSSLGSKWIGNEAELMGGAIWSDMCVGCVLINDTFIDNRAVKIEGGALSMTCLVSPNDLTSDPTLIQD